MIDSRPVVVAACRTPIGAAGGAFGHVAVDQLAAPVISALGSDAPSIAEVILGNCMGPGGNVARVAALAAGIEASVPALTVDRQCASGLAAVTVAAGQLASGAYDLGAAVIAGGAESASTAPWRMWPPTTGQESMRYERARFAPVGMPDPDMGAAADALAAQWGISRSRQDEYAARSHARAIEATRAGAFVGELVPVSSIARDERPREGFGAERMARFPAAFVEGGTVTAANSCGINDGAAACLIVDGESHEASERGGLRILASASAGVDPGLPGLGIVPAVHQALTRAGITMADLDAIEFNEAFAGQVLACCDALGLEDSRVCAQGGALALGHPWGASGAVLMVRLFSQLVQQESGRFGLAAIAAGGGQGVAVVVERCP